MRRRLTATLVVTTTFLLGLCLGASAHALGVNVQTPGASVSIQPGGGVSVTTPGAQVSAGPGGTSVSVSVNPNQALSGIPPVGGVLPPVPGAAPGGPQSAAAAPAPAAPAPARPAGPAPAGSDPAPSTSDPEPARRGSIASGAVRAAAADGADRPAATAPAPDRPRREPRPGRRAEGAPRASVVERIVDRIPPELFAALAATALLAAAMSLVWLRERSRVRAAQREALADPLTGIANRLAFQQRLTQEWKRSRRYGRPLGVLMLDLDGLKQVNDSDGHEAGDRMIRSAAESIAGDIRESDLAARLAGDEFVVLCPETRRPGLHHLATKLEERLEHGGVRASIGWAELSDQDARPEDLVARADEAMYRAKGARRAGRDAATAPQDLAIAS